jgi:hypothetical protein
MKILGIEAGALLALGGSLLGGWLGHAAAFGAGVAVTWKIAAWQADGARAERLAAYTAGLALTNAANEAQRRRELADRERALAAAEAAAGAERARRDELEAILEELRDAPADDDRPLSPTAQHYFDRLRGP